MKNVRVVNKIFNLIKKKKNKLRNLEFFSVLVLKTDCNRSIMKFSPKKLVHASLNIPKINAAETPPSLTSAFFNENTDKYIVSCKPLDNI